MVNIHYDTFIMGHISIDEIIYEGTYEKSIGGAVIYSSYAAKAGGSKVGVLTKVAEEHIDLLRNFNVSKADIYSTGSKGTTSIRNEYLSKDKERRICTALSIAEPFTMEDLPDIDSKIYHFAGLIAGEFKENMIEALSTRGLVALDVQGFLRNAENGKMVFRDWSNKKKYLPHIDFLKTDAAEAEIMTGCQDRREAARVLYGYGAKEIMITHNTEVLVYNGKNYYTAPLKPRNLSGRTGRGDTCFSAYITERLKEGIEKALIYAAALVSAKMETPGPFKGTRKDIEEYIKQFY
ncbi:PfkB family carbohydrate kinase [Clostridium swellfunianum]|uniref:PfkB family carbohydrate kinase n=1 Tax=Clostridium swellfunianum TaxID=1367462 RepID=UPI0020305461|nr:PfkB family carbohydrate kinase [Clostridium swellfunianum]MCM0650811.1 PfkB family carbohydrate kinase [Clostridium swellfunianum]